MKFEELLQKSKKEGLEQGLEEGLEQGMKQGCDLGQNRILKLMNCMIKAGESSELPRLEQDTAFLQEMFRNTIYNSFPSRESRLGRFRPSPMY